MPATNLSNNIKRWLGQRGKRLGRFIQYWGEDVDASMDKWVAKYRKQGILIGTNTALWNVSFDPIYPELITIGNNVTITNTVILTHDDSPVTFTRRRRVAPVCIGDDVFVGWNTLILPGVTIGNNCIIGAGSVVTRSIPDNSIAVGIPAKVVKSMPDHIQHLEVDPFLLEVQVQSNRISDDEHNAMKHCVLKKYRPDLLHSSEISPKR